MALIRVTNKAPILPHSLWQITVTLTGNKGARGKTAVYQTTLQRPNNRDKHILKRTYRGTHTHTHTHTLKNTQALTYTYRH